MTPMNVNALENSRIISIDYLDDGIIVETIIAESYLSLYAENTKSGKKTKNYKNDSGKILYSVTVHGTFNYNGSTSKCTSSTIEVISNTSDWKVYSKSASKSGNKAIGKATMKRYYNGTLLETQYPSVTLTCDKNGKLS